MGSVKQLAGQTIWYGVPTIFSRFLNYLLSLLLVRIFKAEAFGVITNLYAFIPFLNVLFTYGLETAYFRFVQTESKQQVYNTLLISMLVSTAVFTAVLLWWQQPIAQLLEIPDHVEYVRWLCWIVFFDTICTLPFARLRQENRPRKFAFVKVLNIVTNVGFTVFFYLIAPRIQQLPFMGWYDASVGVGYVLVANLIASIVTTLLLAREFFELRWHFTKALWQKIMRYAMPLVVVGFGGMINEMLSRFIFLKVSPLPQEEKLFELGVFGANYKLAVLITIFIQVFKMAAEPFFFNQSKNDDAKATYARVMKFFVLACCLMFLVVALFLDAWKLLIASKNPEYALGINIVPILAMAGVFLGIYYNLSIWYKLTNRNWTGAAITLTGAAITIALNIWWIPLFSYTGSAWATLICYGFMMVASYLLGQRYYPVPYATGRLLLYLVLAIVLYGIKMLSEQYITNPLAGYGISMALLGLFAFIILRSEKESFIGLPVIGKLAGKL